MIKLEDIFIIYTSWKKVIPWNPTFFGGTINAFEWEH